MRYSSVAARSMSPGTFPGTFLVCFVAGVLLSASHAHAAVRLCKAEVSSGVVRAGTEPEAKKRALEFWRSKAMQFGEPFAGWRIAAEKLLTCLPVKEGGFECIARALPCTIDQAPARRELREKRFEM